MSFDLCYGTPAGLQIKTFPFRSIPYIRFGDRQTSLQEFFAIVCEALNRPVSVEQGLLESFINCVCSMQVVDKRLSQGVAFNLKSHQPYDLTKGVCICGYVVTMPDLLPATIYVLTNTDLDGDDDLRLEFVKYVRNYAEQHLNCNIPKIFERVSSLA